MSEHPLNCPVYTECIVTRVLQSFYTSNYFTWDQLEGDTCSFFTGAPPDDTRALSGGAALASAREVVPATLFD
jgi:hypothetical protein